MNILTRMDKKAVKYKTRAEFQKRFPEMKLSVSHDCPGCGYWIIEDEGNCPYCEAINPYYYYSKMNKEV